MERVGLYGEGGTVWRGWDYMERVRLYGEGGAIVTAPSPLDLLSSTSVLPPPFSDSSVSI